MFSKIDFISIYHHVHIKEEEIYMTTFQIRYGYYDFVVVPFSLTNAPKIFMCLMNSVLHPYLDELFIVFIDNIQIYSKNEEENGKHLAAILRFLREHKLYANLGKCSFYQTKVHYLGHVVSKEGIELDVEKIRVVMEWVSPRNVDEA